MHDPPQTGEETCPLNSCQFCRIQVFSPFHEVSYLSVFFFVYLFFFSLSFLVKRMPLFNVVLLILVIGPCDQLLACALDAHCPKRYIPGWLAELRIHSQQRKKDRGIIRCESFHFQIVRFSVCRRVAFDDYYVRYRLSLVKREKKTGCFVLL